MSQNTSHENGIIKPHMTILDIVSRYGQTEAIFKEYDEKAGVCLCCQALFEPLKAVAKRYELDLDHLIADLETVVKLPK